MRNKILNKTKGFTLIEIMLVIGIVTLLASIAMFGATEAKKKAQDTKMIAETKQVETAISLYQASNENEYVPYSTSVGSETGRLYQEGTDEYTANLQPLVTKGYLPSIPKSSDGVSYAYGVSPNKKSGVFVAKLKSRSSNNSNNGGSDPTVHCVEVGIGSGDSCSRIVTSPDVCGLPPYIEKIGDQYLNYTDDSSFYIYIKEMTIVDPEGEEILLNYSPNQTDDCNVLPPNAINCTFYSSKNIQSHTVDFTYNTENCPAQTGSMTIENPNYYESNYTLTINVYLKNYDNVSTNFFKISRDDFGEPKLEKIQSPAEFSRGESVQIYASVYNLSTGEYITLQGQDCDSGGDNTSEGASCGVQMNSNRTISFVEI